MSNKKALGTKKSDIALDIFTKHLPSRASLTKKEFRDQVTTELADTLGITKAGTIGMYFAWADRMVGGRSKHIYNGVSSRKTKGQVVSKAANDKTEAALNQLAASFGKAAAAKKVQPDVVIVDETVASVDEVATKKIKSF